MVYDWDSLVLAPEEVFAGVSAGIFTCQGRPGVASTDAPEPGEVQGFLASYATARGRPWSPPEYASAHAAAAFAVAYNARCDHSVLNGRPPPAGSYLDVLTRHPQAFRCN